METIRDLIGLSAVVSMVIGGMFALEAAQATKSAYHGSASYAVGYSHKAGAK